MQNTEPVGRVPCREFRQGNGVKGESLVCRLEWLLRVAVAASSSGDAHNLAGRAAAEYLFKKMFTTAKPNPTASELRTLNAFSWLLDAAGQSRVRQLRDSMITEAVVAEPARKSSQKKKEKVRADQKQAEVDAYTESLFN